MYESDHESLLMTVDSEHKQCLLIPINDYLDQVAQALEEDEPN